MRAFNFFWLLLLFLIPSALAYDGIFKILDEHFAENASDLPPATNLHPDETLQYGPGSPGWEDRCEGDSTNNCVYGWLDVVGFKNSIRVGDIYYIKGDPADSAIVLYKTYVRINGRYLSDGWIYNLQKYESNGILAVKLTATAILYQIDQSGFFSYANETRDFYKSVPLPKQYPTLKEPQVIITQYNNSMYENVGIKILDDNYTQITFDYKDKHAVRTFQILHAENNSKGLVYGNITDLEQWKIEGPGISRFYNEVLIDGNLSKMDLSEFDIQVYNPFTSKKADPKNFTIERVEFSPQKSISSLLISVLGIVSIFAMGALFLFNKMVSKWKINLF